MSIDNINTKSLLHMDLVSGSAYFKDESSKSWSVYGNAGISTASYKFGGASGYFDGNGDYIGTTDVSDFNAGANNFTFEGFANPTNFSAIRDLFSADSVDYHWLVLFINTTGKLRLFASSNGTSWNLVNAVNGTATISSGTWTHFAIVRNGSYLNVYAGGTLDISANIGAASIYAPQSYIYLAANKFANRYYLGYLDEWRYSNYAVYTSDFTPPTAPFMPKVTKSFWFM